MIPDRRILDDQRMQDIAQRAGKEAARAVLLPLGIDLDDGDSFRAFTADLAFLRRTREQSEKFNSGARLAIFAALASAMAGGLGWFVTFLWPPKH